MSVPDVSNVASGDPSKLPIVNITGERVALGPARRDLIQLYQRWINQFEVVRNLGQLPFPMTLDAETTWYEQISVRGTPFFTIYELSSWRPIGTVALHDLDHQHGTAEFGILIGEPEARGKGLGTEVTRLMINYAFTSLGLHNLMLRALSSNAAGVAAYTKAGFREFGRRREAIRADGRRYDIIYMECLAREHQHDLSDYDV
jgi:diamine N-acetyltransferase